MTAGHYFTFSVRKIFHLIYEIYIKFRHATKKINPFGLVFLVVMGIWRVDSNGRSKQTVRWTVCPAVAFPLQKRIRPPMLNK